MIKKNFCDIGHTKNVGSPLSDPVETRLWYVLKNFKLTCRLNESLKLAEIWYTHSLDAYYLVPQKEIWNFDFLTF